jgi:hypothetical protein
MKKMFDILSPKGNANQNYTKTPSNPSQLAIIKKTNSNKSWREGREKKTLIHC